MKAISFILLFIIVSFGTVKFQLDMRDSAIERIIESKRVELTDDEIRDKIYQSSDQVYFPKTGGSCSVSIIKHNKKVLLITSQHCCENTTFGELSNRTIVTVGKVDVKSDLCELELHNQPNIYFTNRGVPIGYKNTSLMDTVYTVGFSSIMGTNKKGKETPLPYLKINFNEGRIDGNLDDDYNHVSSRMYQGMSGGPALNRSGEIVGINSKTDHYKYGIITSLKALKRFLNE